MPSSSVPCPYPITGRLRNFEGRSSFVLPRRISRGGSSDKLTDEPLDELPYFDLFYRYISESGYNLVHS